MTSAKLDVVIMGVEARLPYIENILQKTGLDMRSVVLDDRGYSGGGNCWYTCRKAWEREIPQGTTHRLLIQDDTLLCNGFLEKVERCIAAFPDAAWTFNGGVWLAERMRKKPSPYILMRGCKCSGEANLFPVEHIQPMIEWSDDVFGREYIHDMSRYGYYCAYHGIKMFGTIPSLVDHLQIPSCIPHHTRRDRVCKTWIGEEIGEQPWDDRDYNESPVIMSNIWLPKDSPRWERINRIVSVCKMKAKGII